MSLKEKGLGNSLVPLPRFVFLEKQAEQVKALPGAVAEIGVYLGGTAKLLAATLVDKDIHLFDTFEGMPEVSKWDKHKKGDFVHASATLDRVKGYLSAYDNVHFYKGVFPETAEDLVENTFCLVHVDVDIYEATKAACEFFWPLLVEGGIMVFDDYNGPRTPGTNKAVNEFFAGVAEIEKRPSKKHGGTRVVKNG